MYLIHTGSSLRKNIRNFEFIFLKKIQNNPSFNPVQQNTYCSLETQKLFFALFDKTFKNKPESIKPLKSEHDSINNGCCTVMATTSADLTFLRTRQTKWQFRTFFWLTALEYLLRDRVKRISISPCVLHTFFTFVY